MNYLQEVNDAVDFIRSRLEMDRPASAGVVLGTGLGDWVASLDHTISIPYELIPGFPHSTVKSQAGALHLARMDGIRVLVLQGRFHLYEGYTPRQVCFGVRVLGLLGIKTLVLTNAAGALNPHFDTGNLMCITDHINATGHNPLIGENIDLWGPRFPDMSRTWSADLERIALDAARESGIRLERGIYVGVTGPCLETPAETRALKRSGADAVGMSTVLEAIAARHMGINLLGISCLTNKNLPDCMDETSLEEVIAQAEAAGKNLGTLLNRILARLG